MNIVSNIFLASMVFCFEAGSASRILAIFPLPFRDHQVIFRPLIEKLADRGHQLTVMTTDPTNFDIQNVDLVDVSFTHNLKVLNDLSESGSSSDILRTVFRVMRTIAETELKSAQVQMLLHNDTESFDVVLVDWAGPSLMNGFAYYFCAPLIGITPGGAYITSHEAMGNPNHPTVFPSILLPFNENLSLLQRIMSAFFSFWYRNLYWQEELPLQHDIAKNYFGAGIPDLWELESSADLLLVNNYQALGNVRPVGPTTVYLGGMHESGPKALTASLEDFLRSSTGAVYINLGAMTKTFVKTSRLERLISILEKSSLEIVWHTNGLPVNVNTTAQVYLSPLVQQEDVLRHKKVQLFITTGGQKDIEDAIHHSVPVLGLTFSSNVEHYLQQILKFEAGSVSKFDRDSDDAILEQIVESLKSDKYKTNIAKLNRLLRDQPQPPVDRAAWWIEYVIRNGGTKHLQHSMNKISWFQYLLLDVFTTLALCTITILSILIAVIIRIRRYSKSLPFEKVTRRTKQKML